MNKRNINTLFALITTVVVLLGALRLRGEEPDKPAGFAGYLLDSRGLEEKNSDSIWSEDFESSGISWRYLYQSGSVKINSHSRVEDFAHGGRRSERLDYEVEDPGVVVFAHYVDYPNIYSETEPSLWIRSDRPGISLAALVVFPKTLRPDNGKPLVALVPGSTYQKPGEWQKLDFPQGLSVTLEKTAQSIRGEDKIPVNVECAYIRQLVLVSEARAGRYSLWIDDLEIAEHLTPSVELLREWERDASFDPINLLTCRLQLSNTPIFGQDDFTESDVYGREPFAIDQAKAADRNKRKLSFTKNATEQNFEAGLGVGTLANSGASTPTTFDAAALLLQSPVGERPRSIEETLAQNVFKPQFEGPAVGQASYTNDSGVLQRVANAAFDASLQAPEDAVVPPAESQEKSELVVGSGTLRDQEDAVTESFRRHNDRLVADAKFHSGLLETQDGQQIYAIRAIEYQGESFEFLKKLGFNAIWLSGAPTARQLSDAEKVGVWLVAAPPVGSNLVSEADVAQAGADAKKEEEDAEKKTSRLLTLTEDAYVTRRYANAAAQGESAIFGGAPVTTAYDPVLLWNMGSGLKTNSITALQTDLKTIRSLDPYKRPVVGSVETGVDAFSQEGVLDALILTREPLLTSLDLNDYGEWLIKYQQLATNSRAVFWNRIQTQPTMAASLQRQFCGMADETPGVVSYEQMRQLVRMSMRAQCRGLLFSSLSRLDAKDHKTQYRAAALESINLELQLIAPWFALGKPDRELLPTSVPGIGGLIASNKRSFLFVPISKEQNNQYVMGQDAANNMTATVPAREGYSPDLLTPGALRKIVSRRRAGGCYFTLDEGSMNSLLFFTQSDSLSQKLSERSPAYGSRLAKLAISLARKRLDLYEQTVYSLRYVEDHGYFPKSAPKSPTLGEMVEKIADQIDEAEVCLQRRDASQAFLIAERATREIRKIEREFWSAATRNEIARPVTPLSTTFYDTPAYLELYDKLLSGKLQTIGGNLIQGGDMENRQAFDSRIWRVFMENDPILDGAAALDSYDPNTDQYAEGVKRQAGKILRLRVTPKSGFENRIPEQTETAVVNIETEFTAQMGQLVCVQGWIKIPKDLTNSVDGIEIYDDQGGRGLALRFKKAMGWTRFAFYRLAASNGPMRVRFSMSGVGEVWLDDVAAYSLGTLNVGEPK